MDEFFETGEREVAEVLELAQRLAPVRLGAALDFGSGAGRLSQALSRRFEHVVGVDISRPMVEVARKLNRFPERCVYLHNESADLAILPSESVDIVYSSITLQHMPPDLMRLYIREFFRVVRRDGHVVFQLPSRPSSRLRWLAKRALPIALTNLAWRLRTGSPGSMEAHFIPEVEARGFVWECGGVVRVAPASDDGPAGWESRKYFCLRRQWTSAGS